MLIISLAFVKRKKEWFAVLFRWISLFRTLVGCMEGRKEVEAIRKTIRETIKWRQKSFSMNMKISNGCKNCDLWPPIKVIKITTSDHLMKNICNVNYCSWANHRWETYKSQPTKNIGCHMQQCQPVTNEEHGNHNRCTKRKFLSNHNSLWPCQQKLE